MLQIQTSNNFSTPKSANYEQPLDLLLSCHTKIRHFSSALDKLTDAIQENGWNDKHITSVEQVRHYFNIASSAHHQDEEKHLFPAIVALESISNLNSKSENKGENKSKFTNIIHRLIKEHHDSDALWVQLDTLLAERSDDFLTLNKLSKQFKLDMHRHAQIEDDIIFPYAKKYISKEDFKKMGLAIARRRGIKV